LQHFFGVQRAAQNAHDDAVRQAAVPIVELRKRGFVARGDALEEREVDVRTGGFHEEPTIAWPRRQPQARPFEWTRAGSARPTPIIVPGSSVVVAACIRR